MTEEVSIEEWKKYLQELYGWITLRYEKFQKGEINENTYLKEYKHYEEETERINVLIDKLEEELSLKVDMNVFRDELTTSLKPIPPEKLPKKKGKIKPEIIESFFFGQDAEEEKEENGKAEKWKSKSLANLSNISPTSQKIEDKTAPPTISEKIEMHEFKIVLLGDSSVGRTSIRRRFMGKNFIEQHLSTVGASIESREIGENKISLYDLGGQDFYSSVRTNFYRNIHGALIVFDVSKRESFMNIDKWIYELFNNITTRTMPFILVGNKIDKRRVVQKKEGEKLAEQLSAQTKKLGFKVEYIETSAKNSTNIDNVILRLIEIIRQLH